MRRRRPSGLSEAEVFAWFMPGDPPAEGCWDWPVSTTNGGYGQFSITEKGKLRLVRAHQASYRLYHGPIPEGLDVLHHCDRPICVHPNCLHVGTAGVNMQEALERNLIPIGERCSWSRLAEADVLWIRQSTLSNAAMARMYHVDPSHISNIRRGKNWKHLL